MSTKVKRLVKWGVLATIKESYLFMRNVYGIYSHPFLTTKRIVEEKDLSQRILLFGLPIYLWLGWVLILLVSRVFITPVGGQVFGELRFGFLAKTSFLLSSLFFSVLMLFLGYWLMEVRRKR